MEGGDEVCTREGRGQRAKGRGQRKEERGIPLSDTRPAL